ncbi:MAG: hypothetical protein AVDCRST_MAG06-2265 [uncultured Nocardioides sp.]|uniref:Uncharacterized protein n=1 Tax=uncultured Nocardioides sp. TaxID=198441 RepID=A0A6J4NZX2_9ACTN|nr:MAG: hypothetical protein AVDCRST_MAG06-2265 [uncultured Nocardioides sp.]
MTARLRSETARPTVARAAVRGSPASPQFHRRGSGGVGYSDQVSRSGPSPALTAPAR